MKKAALIIALRDLQAESYGAEATAQRIADKDDSDRVRRGLASYGSEGHRAVRVGSLQFTTRHLAERIDALVEQLQPRRKGT